VLIECIQGNVLFSNELSRRYADQGIVSVSLNPGNLKTDLQRYVPGVVRAILARSTPFPPLVTNVLVELDPVPGGIRRVDAAVGRHDRRGQDSRGEGAFRSIVVFFFAFDRANEISQYLIPWARVGKANPIALDPETGKALWTWLEEQVADI
jgi:NAD(P)-dependent dehydrogenase (short-subunit alcohol dehydrogenase family)